VAIGPPRAWLASNDQIGRFSQARPEPASTLVPVTASVVPRWCSSSSTRPPPSPPPPPQVRCAGSDGTLLPGTRLSGRTGPTPRSPKSRREVLARAVHGRRCWPSTTTSRSGSLREVLPGAVHAGQCWLSSTTSRSSSRREALPEAVRGRRCWLSTTTSRCSSRREVLPGAVRGEPAPGVPTVHVEQECTLV
jgi:hypothetical protein